jgi:hypothetical protein
MSPLFVISVLGNLQSTSVTGWVFTSFCFHIMSKLQGKMYIVFWATIFLPLPLTGICRRVLNEASNWFD